MKKLHPLLSVLFLIYLNCGEKLREPVGEGFELLNIKNTGEKNSNYKKYVIDILYIGDIQPSTIVSTIKKIHNQYGELKMRVWLSEESYKNRTKGIYDPSIDENLIIKSSKVRSKGENQLVWIQVNGDYEELYRKKISFNKQSGKNPIKSNQSERVEKESVKKEEIVITDYNCRLLPHPDNNVELTRIPKNTELVVIESRDFQQGRLLNKWYKVKYNNKVGWCSSFNMKTQPKVRIVSIEESKKNYEKQIGKRPYQNPLTGTISIVDKWLKDNKNNYESIKYRQWYEPYVIDNQWVCRVEYDEKISGLEITSDMLFFTKDNKVKSVSYK